jgi:hypothetical protein
MRLVGFPYLPEDSHVLVNHLQNMTSLSVIEETAVWRRPA